MALRCLAMKPRPAVQSPAARASALYALALVRRLGEVGERTWPFRAQVVPDNRLGDIPAFGARLLWYSQHAPRRDLNAASRKS